MLIKITNLSQPEVFKNYSARYKIFRDVYGYGLIGIELNNINAALAETVQKIVLREKEICYKASGQKTKYVDLLIPGFLDKLKEIARKIVSHGDEDIGYKIINVIKNYEEYDAKVYQIGNRTFNFNKSYVMGVLNVTPDSFSDGGKFHKPDDAFKYAEEMLGNGVDIIDVGGESSRPGSEPVSPESELKRVMPVIEKILKNYPETILSIDTTKKIVAEEALRAGVKIVNEISGFTFDPSMIDVVKKYNAAGIVMHMKGIPADMQNNPVYEDVVKEVYDFLSQQALKLSKKGINKIFIDPGIGFGKRVEDNVELLRRLEDFKSMGYPILIGVSRKSFIGKILELDVDKRDIPSAVIESLAIRYGARIIRTHNSKIGVQTSKLTEILT